MFVGCSTYMYHRVPCSVLLNSSIHVDLKFLLTPEAVTDLVMVSIRNLPQRMPRTFRNSYTPIAAAGTDAQVTYICNCCVFTIHVYSVFNSDFFFLFQVSHLARLLASQMTTVGIGVGAKAKNIRPLSKVNHMHESPASRLYNSTL